MSERNSLDLLYLLLPIIGAFLLIFTVCCCGRKVKEMLHFPKEFVMGHTAARVSYYNGADDDSDNDGGNDGNNNTEHDRGVLITQRYRETTSITIGDHQTESEENFHQNATVALQTNKSTMTEPIDLITVHHSSDYQTLDINDNKTCGYLQKKLSAISGKNDIDLQNAHVAGAAGISSTQTCVNESHIKIHSDSAGNVNQSQSNCGQTFTVHCNIEHDRLNLDSTECPKEDIAGSTTSKELVQDDQCGTSSVGGIICRDCKASGKSTSDPPKCTSESEHISDLKITVSGSGHNSTNEENPHETKKPMSEAMSGGQCSSDTIQMTCGSDRPG